MIIRINDHSVGWTTGGLNCFGFHFSFSRSNQGNGASFLPSQLPFVAVSFLDESAEASDDDVGAESVEEGEAVAGGPEGRTVSGCWP